MKTMATARFRARRAQRLAMRLDSEDPADRLRARRALRMQMPGLAESLEAARWQEDGGPGSGNWGHAGRPGKLGGSAPGGGKSNRISTRNGFVSLQALRNKYGKPGKYSVEELSKMPTGSVVCVTRAGGGKERYVYQEDKHGDHYFTDQSTGKMAGYCDFRPVGSDYMQVSFPEEAVKRLREEHDKIEGVKGLATYGDVKGGMAKIDATRDKTAREYDDLMREETGRAWRNCSDEEKNALYDYTSSYYRPMNDEMRTGKSPSARTVNAMNATYHSTLREDCLLYRNVTFKGASAHLGVPEEALSHYVSTGRADSLVGLVATDDGFMSCTSSRECYYYDGGSVNYRIYVPEGTCGIYAEPYSAFGDGARRGWDGFSRQSTFGGEDETVLQAGTEIAVVGAEVGSRGEINIDAVVIGQTAW